MSDHVGIPAKNITRKEQKKEVVLEHVGQHSWGRFTQSMGICNYASKSTHNCSKAMVFLWSSQMFQFNIEEKTRFSSSCTVAVPFLQCLKSISMFDSQKRSKLKNQALFQIENASTGPAYSHGGGLLGTFIRTRQFQPTWNLSIWINPSDPTTDFFCGIFEKSIKIHLILLPNTLFHCHVSLLEGSGNCWGPVAFQI